MTVECDLDGTEEHRTENTVADFFSNSFVRLLQMPNKGI